MRTKIKLCLFLLLFAFSLTFTLFSCSSNPTEPPPPPPPPPVVEPDSTTQNFTFETFEFGSGGESSWLNDVWIFNENNIWAVGYIDVTSTSGRTNIVRWDGTKWGGFGGQFNSAGFDGIWAADSNNIYFASGVIRKYENGAIKTIDLTNLSFSQGQAITKLWGSSTSNIWGVGPWGTIVHYDGNNWTKIDFDQQWYFYGITGNPETGIAYAYAQNNNDIRIIVQLSISSATVIHQSKQITAVKANAMNFIDSALYLAGSDFSSTLLWKFNLQTKKIDSLFTLVPTTGLYQATGNKKIDYYFWGDDYGTGKMVQYNGKRFKVFDLPKASDNRGGANTNGNVSAFVGYADNKGYVTIVKRIE